MQNINPVQRLVLLLLTFALAASACGNSVTAIEPEAASQPTESTPPETTTPQQDGEDTPTGTEDPGSSTAPPTTRAPMIDEGDLTPGEGTGAGESEEKADRMPSLEEPLGVGLEMEEITELWVEAVRSNDLDLADAYLNPPRRNDAEGTASLARELTGNPFTDFQVFGVQLFTDAEGFVETTFTSTTDGTCERWTIEFVMVLSTVADAWQIDGHNDYTTECAESMQPAPITPTSTLS